MAESQTEKKKLSKSEKKAARKQAKSQHLLLKHDGIATSDVPTKFLLIGNGGLLNGIQHEELSLLFKHYGDVEEIVMLPGKPYSFVCFKGVEDAMKAQENLQGYQLRDGQGPSNIKMYLSFVKQVPNSSAASSSLPPGLILVENFIDEEMEEKLLASIEWNEESIAAETAQQSLKHRRVKHHGYEFLYTTNNIDKEHPLPDGIPAIYGHVIDDIMATGHVQYRPDQVTINQYQPGQGIPSHVDTHSAFEDAIISLSLGSQVLMEFSHPDGRHIPVLLHRRCLAIMTREARYLWAHGITPRKGDIVPSKSDENSATKEGLTQVPRGVRTSLTFRAIRKEPCKCDYAIKCDSQKSKTISMVTEDHKPSASLPASEQEAAMLEQTHVHEVYEKIAEHFSDTRHKPWPRVAEFLNKLRAGSVCLDVGCGNGKYLGVNSNLYMIGCDRSHHLVDICQQRQFQAFTSDALQLPVRSSSVDACICIAVIHHFSTKARREKAVSEIIRILNPGGLALIYVWAVEQERNKKKSNYIKGQKSGKMVSNATKILADDKESNSTPVAGTQGCDRGDQHSTSEVGFEMQDTDGGNNMEKTEAKSEINQSTSAVVVEESEGVESKDSCQVHANKRTDVNVGDLDITDNTRDSDLNAAHDHNESPSEVGNKTAGSQENQELCTDTSTSKSITKNQAQNKLPIHKNRTQFVQPDLLVPWHMKIKKGTSEAPLSTDAAKAESVVYHRYYHVFKDWELEQLCLSIGDVRIVESYYDQGNWCVIFQKK